MGNAGRVLMIPKGDYNPATPYEMLDCVYYNGRSYVCKQASTGHAPTDIMYWQPMTPDSSAEIQALTNYVGDSGVKNQLNTKALLDISTSAGITYSLNDDESIDVQAGTTTAELIILSTYRSKGVAIPYKPNTKYIFSIGENKKQANLALQVLCKETSSSSWSTLGSGTNVDSVEFTTPATMYELWIRLDVASGKAVTATTLFPMVRDATITDPTYAPYAKTNVELTQDVAGLSNGTLYKQAGLVTNSNPTVTVPKAAKELSLMVYLNDSYSANGIINIPTTMLTTNAKTFYTGAYFSGADSASASVIAKIVTGGGYEVSFDKLYINGASVDLATKCNVFYR